MGRGVFYYKNPKVGSNFLIFFFIIIIMIGIISVILPYAISTRKEHRLIVSDKFEDTNGVTRSNVEGQTTQFLKIKGTNNFY